jgi:hypothetical protein
MADNPAPSSPETAEMGFMGRFLRLAGLFFMAGDQRWKATAALDDDNLKAMISIFKGELRWTTLLPVAPGEFPRLFAASRQDEIRCASDHAPSHERRARACARACINASRGPVRSGARKRRRRDCRYSIALFRRLLRARGLQRFPNA